MALAPGTRLGPYQIVAPLGAGGMGEVYRAHDTRLGRDVAVKVLPQHLSASPEDRARFKREAKTISWLNHPHICVLHDVGQEGDIDYLVMELVDGETLAQRIARGALPSTEVLRLGAQIAGALDHAHRAGVAHRDLKPGNVMLTRSGAKLMDFGLARQARRASHTRAVDVTETMPGQAPGSEAPITAKGTIVGTFQYMAPEQLEGKETDARSDLWALGCVLYEIATGWRAFEGSTPASLISAIMRDQPRVMAELAPMTPPELERVVRQCLAKDPDDRWQSAGDLQKELLRIAEAGTTAPRPHGAPERLINDALSPPTPRRGLWRSHYLLIVTLGTLAAIAVVGGMVMWSRNGSHPQRRAGASTILKTPLLVADFDGQQSDPQLLVAARQLVVGALDQSDRFESVSREGMKLALEAAGKPDSIRVDGALARELAFRNGIKVTIEGRVDRVGRALSILLAARDADDGHVLHSIAGSAPGEEALISTIGGLTQQLRKKLGERPDALASHRIRLIAATPSFEAYRKFSSAFELQNVQGDDRGSLVLLRDALRIDPEFAGAWALKLWAHSHLRESDSASAALAEALKHSQRLPEEQKLFLQGMEDAEHGDLEGAEAKYRELIRRGYALSSSLGNHGHILWRAGRYEEALGDFRRAAHVSPFGPQQWVLNNLIDLLLMFGQVREAQDEARGLRGWYADLYRLALAASAGDWTRADSVAATLSEDPTRSVAVRHASLMMRAAVSAARRSVREAREFLNQAQRRAEASNRAGDVDESLERRLILDAAAGSAGGKPSIGAKSDHSPGGIAIRGLIAAQSGDLGLAKQALKTAGSHDESPAAGESDGRAVLEAYIVGCEGGWGRAARMLASWARLGERPQSVLSPVLVRWLTAQAFDRSGQLDSAAVYYELALDPTRLYWQRRLDIMFVSSAAHNRLAKIYADAGRSSDAGRHREILEKGFTRSDPGIRLPRDH